MTNNLLLSKVAIKPLTSSVIFLLYILSLTTLSGCTEEASPPLNRALPSEKMAHQQPASHQKNADQTATNTATGNALLTSQKIATQEIPHKEIAHKEIATLYHFAQVNCLFWFFKAKGYDTSDLQSISGGIVETSHIAIDKFQNIALFLQQDKPSTHSKHDIDPSLQRCFALESNLHLKKIIQP